MCKPHGGSYVGNVPVVLSHPYSNGKDVVHVDPCMQQLVQALNLIGMQTLNCCCGHGHQPGWVALEDGRHILIAPDYESMLRMRSDFPINTNGEVMHWNDPVV